MAEEFGAAEGDELIAQVIEHEGGEVFGLFAGAVAEVGGALLGGGLLGELAVLLFRTEVEGGEQAEEKQRDDEEAAVESLALEKAWHAAVRRLHGRRIVGERDRRS